MHSEPSMILSSKGFSLVGILTALALAGIISLGFVTIQSKMGRYAQLMDIKSSLLLFDADVLRIGENQEVCKRAFWTTGGVATYSGTEKELDRIQIKDMVVARQNSKLSPGFQIDKLKLSSRDTAGGIVLSGGSHRWDIDLVVSFTETTNQNRTREKKYPFVIQTDPTGKIVSCSNLQTVSVGGFTGSCDAQTGTAAPYNRTVNNQVYQVIPYGHLNNSQIDDGGNSGEHDTADFYCVNPIANGNQGGSLSVCLSKEACPWR